MSEDLLDLYHTLEKEMKEALREFDPEFQMSGSMIEGTRLGLANELDIGLIFNTLKDSLALKVEGDPFSLKKSDTAPAFMKRFFDGNEFDYHDFKLFLLDTFSNIIKDIFDKHKLSGSNKLICVTTNEAWAKGETKCNGDCKRKMKKADTKYEQCILCCVCVSQTKIGIALQFQWVFENAVMGEETKCQKHENSGYKNLLLNDIFKDEEIITVYCSIDIIPELPIEEIDAFALASLVNRSMLAPNSPEKWLRCICNYVKHYQIINDIIHSEKGMISSVVLKTMNFCEQRNHHVRPSQPHTLGEKFQSVEMKKIYCYIKYLKKSLDLDLSSYWVKKELLKQEYQDIVDSKKKDLFAGDNALVAVLSQPEFQSQVGDKIDIKKSNNPGISGLYKICLKKKQPALSS